MTGFANLLPLLVAGQCTLRFLAAFLFLCAVMNGPFICVLHHAHTDTLKVFNGKVEGGQDRSSELPHANEDKESFDQLLTEGPH